MLKYFGFYDTNPDSATYRQILNVARIQEPPDLISQRWNKMKKKWIDDIDVYFSITQVIDGLEYRPISEAESLVVTMV